MKQGASQTQNSPVNIDQNRGAGQEGPDEGSRAGRDAAKAHDFPAEDEQADPVGSQSSPGRPAQEQSTREDAIRNAAYEAYQRRGGMPGSETEDWLEAEAQVDRQKGD